MVHDARIWIFDCDGVILDSNGMKTAAFAHVLRDYPDAARAGFRAFQQTAFGMSRYRQFEVFFDRFLGRPPGPGEMEAILDAFAAYCRETYPRQPVTPGAPELFDRLADRGVTLYVASGSAEAELRDVLAEIGLARHFAAIHGSPRPKADIIRAILERHPGQRAVMLGDARADFEAAETHGVPFLYISDYAADPETMTGLKARHGFAEARSLADLVPALAEAE